MFLAVYDGENFGAENFGEALIVTFVSMFLVFIILILLYGLINFLKGIKITKSEVSEKDKTVATLETEPKIVHQPVGVSTDDEEAEVAAIVAAIEYKNELNEEANVVSIKKTN
ncbi:MAG: OadG family transporter subunit [Bacilli bacterium]|jgi:Na+-transporting methylmalonyl-CoA/oxaloacetate decarboxylase gamma subunit